jgi:hypothetical protein
LQLHSFMSHSKGGRGIRKHALCDARNANDAIEVLNRRCSVHSDDPDDPAGQDANQWTRDVGGVLREVKATTIQRWHPTSIHQLKGRSVPVDSDRRSSVRVLLSESYKSIKLRLGNHSQSTHCLRATTYLVHLPLLSRRLPPTLHGSDTEEAFSPRPPSRHQAAVDLNSCHCTSALAF